MKSPRIYTLLIILPIYFLMLTQRALADLPPGPSPIPPDPIDPTPTNSAFIYIALFCISSLLLGLTALIALGIILVKKNKNNDSSTSDK